MSDAVEDRLAAFCPDQAGETMLSAELGASAGSVLERSGGEMRGDADVHRAAIPIGHDVDQAAVSLFHAGEKRRSGTPGSSPG